jgi:hypothetical protein
MPYLDTPFATYTCQTTGEVMAVGGRILTYTSSVVKTIAECSSICSMTPACYDFGWVNGVACYLYSTNRGSISSSLVVNVSGASWCMRNMIY